MHILSRHVLILDARTDDVGRSCIDNGDVQRGIVGHESKISNRTVINRALQLVMTVEENFQQIGHIGTADVPVVIEAAVEADAVRQLRPAEGKLILNGNIFVNRHVSAGDRNIIGLAGRIVALLAEDGIDRAWVGVFCLCSYQQNTTCFYLFPS